MAKQNSSKFLLYLMDGSPTAVPKLIAEQINMTISRSTNTIDVTSKTNGGYEEFIGGLKSGEVSGELIMDVDVVDDANTVSSNTMSAIEIARTVRTYQAKLVSASKTFVTQFNGLITKFDIGAPLEDKITVSFTIKRSGAPTETVTVNP